MTHLQGAQNPGDGRCRMGSALGELPNKPKSVKIGEMRVEAEAGLVEGECEGWKEKSQAKTSPLEGGWGWGSLIQVLDWKGGRGGPGRLSPSSTLTHPS